MALVPNTFKSQLKTALKNIQCDPNNPDAAIDAFCDAFVNSIDAYIKSATVTVQPGQAVTTPAGPGSTTTPGTGSLS